MSEADGFELELRSAPRVLCDVRDRVRDWTRACGWSEQQIAEIVLAVDEALTNVIVHGYEGREDQRILFGARCVCSPDGRAGVEFRVRDWGRQVDPASIRGRALDEVRPGGLGVHLIFSMMSRAEYSRAEGGGMLLVMTKFKDHTARVPLCDREEPCP
jgi:anti-sigma regulatory factor (Ser/Thr protein kinase)